MKTDGENLRQFQDVCARVDRVMTPHVDWLIEVAEAAGLQSWEIADGFVIAAYRVLSSGEPDKRRLDYANHAKDLASKLTQWAILEVEDRTRKEHP